MYVHSFTVQETGTKTRADQVLIPLCQVGQKAYSCSPQSAHLACSISLRTGPQDDATGTSTSRRSGYRLSTEKSLAHSVTAIPWRWPFDSKASQQLQLQVNRKRPHSQNSPTSAYPEPCSCFTHAKKTTSAASLMARKEDTSVAIEERLSSCGRSPSWMSERIMMARVHDSD